MKQSRSSEGGYQQQSRVQLICIPFAGGNSYSFRDLRTHLADSIDFHPVELPGRGRRFGEPLLTSMTDMADDLLVQVRDLLKPPYAFYGHSLGGRLAGLLARQVVALELPCPIHLFVSGCPGPSVVKDRRRHELPRSDFFAMLKGMGCPPEVLASEEVMALFEPVLRADLEANDTFRYVPGSPYDIQISAMIGTEEDTTREEALAWQKETTQELALSEFPGGHFFIYEHLNEIGSLLSTRLLDYF